MQILCVILAVLMAVFGIAAFIYAYKVRKEWRETEKLIAAEEKKVNETITEANQTKADARSGDHNRDINYMADRLHQFSKK